MGQSWYCDACRETIRNHRWHCTVCSDFDLCYNCKGAKVMKNEQEHTPEHEMTEHDVDQNLPPLKNSDGVEVSRVTETVWSCQRSDLTCSAEALCASCAEFNASLTKNRRGAPVFRGIRHNTFEKLYCNRFIGDEIVNAGASDGRCGPNEGPQCKDCISLDKVIQRNSKGSPVFKAASGLYFCHRWKPDNSFCIGEQCDACKEFQLNPTEMKPEEREPTNNDLKYMWRRELLFSLYKDGVITRAQFTTINKANKMKLEIPPKLPGVSPEVRILFHMLTKDEEFIKNKIQALWDKYDTNKNGNLEIEEAQKFFADFEEATLRASGKDVPSSTETLHYAALYDEIDTNKSGGIDFDEFFCFLKKKSEEYQASKEAAFSPPPTEAVPECKIN